MAKDADGKPPETRGRRGKSQAMRDISERLRSIGALGESLPASIRSGLALSFVAFIVWATRLRLTIEVSKVTDPMLAMWSGDDGLSHTIVYKGNFVSAIDVGYPDAGTVEALSSLLVLMSSGTEGLFEVASDAVIIGAWHNFYVQNLFHNVKYRFHADIWVQMGKPKGERKTTTYKGVTYEYWELDITKWAVIKRIESALASLAVAAICWMLLSRGVREK